MQYGPIKALDLPLTPAHVVHTPTYILTHPAAHAMPSHTHTHLRRASSSLRFCSARFMRSSFSDLSIALCSTTSTSTSSNEQHRTHSLPKYHHANSASSHAQEGNGPDHCSAHWSVEWLSTVALAPHEQEPHGQVTTAFSPGLLATSAVSDPCTLCCAALNRRKAAARPSSSCKKATSTHLFAASASRSAFLCAASLSAGLAATSSPAGTNVATHVNPWP